MLLSNADNSKKPIPTLLNMLLLESLIASLLIASNVVGIPTPQGIIGNYQAAAERERGVMCSRLGVKWVPRLLEFPDCASKLSSSK